MQFDQTIRRLIQGARRRLAGLARVLRPRMPKTVKLNWRLPALDFSRITDRLAGLGIGLKLGVAGGVAVLLVLYYVFGAFFMSKIDADLAFVPPAADAPKSASQAVAMTAALIDREAKRWVPNDPFFKPTYILHNMPSFQRGMLQAFQRFTIALNDQLGRTRGSSPTDPDLEKAAGDIRYSADRWIWNADRWWAINLTAEDSYRRAAKDLRAYNKRLALGQATFERRASSIAPRASSTPSISSCAH